MYEILSAISTLSLFLCRPFHSPSTVWCLLTLLSQRNSDPGQLIFTWATCAAKSSGVICFSACSRVLGFAGPADEAAFCFLEVSPADLVLRGDIDLLFEDVLDVDLAGEWDLLLLSLEPNKLRYCCVGTAVGGGEKERGCVKNY